MTRLRIGSIVCDMADGGASPLSEGWYDLSALADPESGRTGRSAVFRLPSTPRNDAAVMYAADPFRSGNFNGGRREASVEADGAVLLRGSAVLEAVERDAEGIVYEVRVTGDAAPWAETAARSMFGAIPLEYDARLLSATVEESWAGDSPVKFLPVYRDGYTAAYNSSSLYPPQRILTTDDYHPFISVEALVRAVFGAAGYEAESRFMRSDEFRKLYMSGRYASRSTDRMEASMGFCAGRVSEAEVEADAMGRAYMSPLAAANSLGNFVQTADPADGGGLFANSGVLTIDGEGVLFTPPAEVNAGFELRLCYTTDYRILSRERLAGFDSVYVDSGCDMVFGLANPFEDRRGATVAGNRYRCVVFDHAEGRAYRVVCGEGSGETVAAEFAARTAEVTVPAGAGAGAGSGGVRLLYGVGDGTYAPYGGDWALYDGHVGETGRTEVDITFGTGPERISPSSPKSFVRMYLHGAEEGQRVTLGRQCRLRPVFSAVPAAGSRVTFADMAHYDIRQSEFLKAVGQMFNLLFYTDVRRRKVYVEPYDDFFRDDEVDWSGRIDLTCEVRVRDMACEVHRTRTLAYRADGGGAVERFDAEHGEKFGEWSFATDSQAAKNGVRRMTNALFCPSLNAVGVYASAPSASVVQTGDRDADGEGTAARIVRYEGMRSLPEGERWGFPSYGAEYPYAAFHYAAERAADGGLSWDKGLQEDGGLAAGDGSESGGGSVTADGEGKSYGENGPVGRTGAAAEAFTLCFEDRDGAEGLHRRYDAQWRAQSFRSELRATVRLDPDELEHLLDYEYGGPNIRSLFRLGIGAETALYRLAAVESYDPRERRALCRFFRAAGDGGGRESASAASGQQ